jgi:hypothetical protein
LDQLARRTATYIYGLYSAHTAPDVAAMIFRPECALELQALAAARIDPRLSGLTKKVKQLTANSGSAHWGPARTGSNQSAPTRSAPAGQAPATPAGSQPNSNMNRGGRRLGPGDTTRAGQRLACFNCGSSNHFTRSCDKPRDDKKVEESRLAYMKKKEASSRA